MMYTRGPTIHFRCPRVHTNKIFHTLIILNNADNFILLIIEIVVTIWKKQKE